VQFLRVFLHCLVSGVADWRVQVAGGPADAGPDAALPAFDGRGAMVLENNALTEAPSPVRTPHAPPTTPSAPTAPAMVEVRPLTPHALEDANTQAFARARSQTPRPTPPRPARLYTGDSAACLVGIP
jgi:hypothetical protein